MSLDASTDAQYQALVQTCGFVELRDRTWLEVRGGDRVTFLQNLATNDVASLSPGKGCEAFITSVRGRTVSHVFLFCDEQHLILETSPGQASTLIDHLDRYIIREDVELLDRTGQWQQLLVGGPDVTVRFEQLSLPVPSEMLEHVSAEVQGGPVSVRRVPWTHEAWSICGTEEVLRSISDQLETFGAVRCGDPALEVARIEQGFPRFGRDISDANLPQEVDRNDVAINFTKGCYLGQETVARIDAVGHVNRTLCGLKFDSDQIPQAGLPLTREGKEVGQVTSAAWSPRCDAPLALGYVRRGANEPGIRLDSPLGAVEVIDLPVPPSAK